MRLLFVLNPNSSGSILGGSLAQVEKNILRHIVRHPKGKDVFADFIAEPTLESAKLCIHERLRSQAYYAVVAVGGDGTVRYLLAILAEEYPGISLGILPNGAGNLLATHLGIPLDPDAAINCLLTGRFHPMDIGHIETQQESHYFSIMAGAGMDAEIVDSVDRLSKQRWRFWAYFIHAFRKLFNSQRTTFQVQIDHQTIRTRAVSVVIANAANFLGSVLTLAPHAKVDDGLLDILIFRIQRSMDVFPLLLQVISQQENLQWSKSQIIRSQGKRVLIHSKKPVKVQADGDIVGTTPVSVEVLAGRIFVLKPNAKADPKARLQTETDRPDRFKERIHLFTGWFHTH